MRECFNLVIVIIVASRKCTSGRSVVKTSLRVSNLRRFKPFVEETYDKMKTSGPRLSSLFFSTGYSMDIQMAKWDLFVILNR